MGDFEALISVEAESPMKHHLFAREILTLIPVSRAGDNGSGSV